MQKPSKRMQALSVGIALLGALSSPGFAQPGAPPQTEKERKAHLLNAELFIAIRDHDLAQVNAVLGQGADPNGRNWLGFSPLMWAANSGALPIVDTLLAHHAELEGKSIYGTPLSFALVGRREDIALHLLDRGASIHTDRADAATPLMIAGANGERVAIQRLLAKKDNPNARDADGATPLIYAARNGQTEIVQTLLQAGAEVNAPDSHGRTALMYAAENSQAPTLTLLLAHKAAVNVADKGGATALLLAARYSGDAAIVRSLLQAGADATKADGRGATALTLAEARGYTAVAQALRQPGAAQGAAIRVSLSERSRPAVERSLTALQNSIKTFSSRAQMPFLASDAYATGMALYALHVGGELSTDDPAYQRGIQFLLRTQDEDGSWYVNKLANPANIYLDAGFPHGESQYTSFAATCWAAMALAQGQESTQSAQR
ncbi:MAG TPA: ankyrin repeat domain-containing protein [Chthonomonadaceae bacterium]|nr:ankyrin repeat domain-containing protein [Chthonomonadaceae bacterium]